MATSGQFSCPPLGSSYWPLTHGIKKVRRVLTDNGSWYRPLLFNAALAKSRTRHKWTRPYRPQTNGKVERYQRTLAHEWAYSRAWSSNAERATAPTSIPRPLQLRSTTHRTQGQVPSQSCPHRCHQPRGMEHLVVCLQNTLVLVG